MGKSQNVDDLSKRIFRATKRTSASDNHESLAEYDEVNTQCAGSQQVLPMDTRDTVIVQSLPDKFNSMIGESIDIESDHARELIPMLGEKLGINDYRRNLASFWLLDAIALQVIRKKHKLIPVNLAVLVSWIAGEAKFIQERQFSRTEFFREIGLIFSKASDLLNKSHAMMYWEEIIERESSPQKHQEFKDDRQEGANASSRSNSKLSFPDELEDDGNFEVATGTYNNIQKSYGRQPADMSQESNPVITNPMDVLEAIVESTYDLYANAFHYESVSTVFVRGITFHSYQLPYTLRYPRSIQLPVLPAGKTEAPNEGVRGKARSRSDKGKPGNTGKEEKESKSSAQVPAPPPSMTEEEMIAQKRKHILPLMESIEAPRILDQFAQSANMSHMLAETKLDRKGRRKT